MHFVRQAAWLGACLATLAPQVSLASTARTRLAVGVKVVTPCRIGMQVDAPVACMGRVARVTRADGSPVPIAGPRAAETAPSYANFVEVTF